MSSLCIIDTGVNPHIDLMMPRMRIDAFVDIIGRKTIPYDDNGHGTFVAGVAVGSGIASGMRVRGSSASNIVVIKAINSEGVATKVDILKSIKLVHMMHRKYGIKAVLMSFGAEDDGTRYNSLNSATDTLYDAGIVTISATGNGGYNHVKSPATSDRVISVGAIDDDLKICPFTARGVCNGRMKPDFYSYGKDVIGLHQVGYTHMSGTSVAAPYVAGIVMRIFDELPSAKPSDIMRILDRLALKYNGISII